MTHSPDPNRTAPLSPPLSPPLPIQTSFEDHVGIIALDHYAKRNALSAEMIAAILAAFEIFKARQVRVVILRSAQNGPRLVVGPFRGRAARRRPRPAAL